MYAVPVIYVELLSGRLNANLMAVTYSFPLIPIWDDDLKVEQELVDRADRLALVELGRVAHAGNYRELHAGRDSLHLLRSLEGQQVAPFASDYQQGLASERCE